MVIRARLAQLTTADTEYHTCSLAPGAAVWMEIARLIIRMSPTINGATVRMGERIVVFIITSIEYHAGNVLQGTAV